MKALPMEAIQAIVITNNQLRDMLIEAARMGAIQAVEALRAELQQSPDDAVINKLKAYLADPTSIPNPHEHWAHSGIICQIERKPNGKPKSAAWFMRFQRETGLADCFTRPSPAYGRRREWSFHDIRLAWNTYYRRK